jgi:hypothetical protein
MNANHLPKRSGLSRREFLQILGVAGGALSATTLVAFDDKEPFAQAQPGRWPIFRLVRPRDLLVVRMERPALAWATSWSLMAATARTRAREFRW